MKSKDVIVGGTYLVKVSGKLTTVKITAESPHKGWVGKNIVTGREVRIKSAQKLRVPVGATLKEYVREKAPHVLCEQTPVSEEDLARFGKEKVTDAKDDPMVRFQHHVDGLDNGSLRGLIQGLEGQDTRSIPCREEKLAWCREVLADREKKAMKHLDRKVKEEMTMKVKNGKGGNGKAEKPTKVIKGQSEVIGAETKVKVEKAKAEKAAKKAKANGNGHKVGVISTIIQLLQEAPKGGISLDHISETLAKKFPERDSEAMGRTVSRQVKVLLVKERQLNVVKVGEDKYRIA